MLNFQPDPAVTVVGCTGSCTWSIPIDMIGNREGDRCRALGLPGTLIPLEHPNEW
jgi:hypothetical protein